MNRHRVVLAWPHPLQLSSIGCFLDVQAGSNTPLCPNLEVLQVKGSYFTVPARLPSSGVPDPIDGSTAIQKVQEGRQGEGGRHQPG